MNFLFQFKPGDHPQEGIQCFNISSWLIDGRVQWHGMDRQEEKNGERARPET